MPIIVIIFSHYQPLMTLKLYTLVQNSGNDLGLYYFLDWVAILNFNIKFFPLNIAHVQPRVLLLLPLTQVILHFLYFTILLGHFKAN